MNSLNGESKKLKSEDFEDRKNYAVHKNIKNLLDIKESDFQKEIFFYKENERIGLEIKFYDKKLSDTNFNLNEFIINIHIDKKIESGDKEFKLLLDFVKNFNKNETLFEVAKDVKNKSYKDVATYRDFSVRMNKHANLTELEKLQTKV
jgi:hypothetical protein